MKKVLSILLIGVLMLSGVVGFASAEGLEIIDFNDKASRDAYSFNLKYRIVEGKKGDSHEIQLPFPVTIEGGEYLEVVDNGNGAYTLILLDDFINITGNIRGKRTVRSSEELNPIVINGSTYKNREDYPQISTDNPGTATERDRFYKIGTVNGDIIDWEVVIGGDEKGVKATSITDEIGDGHELIEESVEFAAMMSGSYNNDLVDMIVSNLRTDRTEINFNIDTMSPGEILFLNYKTKITDSSKSEFSNQLIIEGEKKITESVEIESSSDIDGEKPTEPELPVLPQVGESFMKLEYLGALLLIISAIVIRKRK